MSYIRSFGAALPSRVVTNEELSVLVGKSPEWIRNVSGIEQRRWAEDGVTICDLAVQAAQEALSRAGLKPRDLGIVLVASGSWDRQFPGPASQVASHLGLGEIPAIDVPLASAGALFGMALADQLSPAYGPALVVASEIMSRVARRAIEESGVSALFGDGAGACIIHPQSGVAAITAHRLGSDGSFAGDLALGFGSPLIMNGRTVILQASRKIPRVIREVLELRALQPTDVGAFVMHQANQNLIDRVADALGVERKLFFSNIRLYGNTSSASMLIAAREWMEQEGFQAGERVCLAAFGAGFHWGAALLEAA